MKKNTPKPNKQEEKTKIRLVQIFTVLLFASNAFALKPHEILIVANTKNEDSIKIAKYYSYKRNIPQQNIVELDLKAPLNDNISRHHYNTLLAAPLREKITNSKDRIRCVVLTYGVPYKLGGRIISPEEKKQIEQLLSQADLIAKDLRPLVYQLDLIIESKKPTPDSAFLSDRILKTINSKLKQAESKINKMRSGPVKDSNLRILNKAKTTLQTSKDSTIKLNKINHKLNVLRGKETNASVDSELSLIMYNDYNLYRYQPNDLRGDGFDTDSNTLMVARLDGPSPAIVFSIIQKAIDAETTGLFGKAYFDAQGKKPDRKFGSFGYFDLSIRNAASIVKADGRLLVQLENTGNLFAPGQCPQTALYCGWYSLKKYIDAFDFVDGAIGYHIASWEAIDLRDPNSTQWCPAMLMDGITATFGAVAEPYLHSFPEPDKFFSELIAGRCLAEAYYRTKPFNSWMMILIGDPLYTPFKKKPLIK